MAKIDWQNPESWDKVVKKILTEKGIGEEVAGQVMAELRRQAQVGPLSTEAIAEALRNLGEHGVQTPVNIKDEETRLRTALGVAANIRTPEGRSSFFRRFFGGKRGKEREGD